MNLNKLESLIERIVELETDNLDKKLMNGELTEDEYEDALNDLDHWAEETYRDETKS